MNHSGIWTHRCRHPAHTARFAQETSGVCAAEWSNSHNIHDGVHPRSRDRRENGSHTRYTLVSINRGCQGYQHVSLGYEKRARSWTNKTHLSKTTLRLPSDLFFQPVPPGLESIDLPVYCFLISNGNRHVLFDLGVRKDWENYSPSMVSLIQSISEVHSPTNISEILDANSKSTGITSRDIEAVIWSHQHFDHIGDVTTFPRLRSSWLDRGFGTCVYLDILRSQMQ